MQKDIKLGLLVGLVLLVICGFFYHKMRAYQREHPQEKNEAKQPVLRSSGTGSEERDAEKRILHQLIYEYWDLAEQGDVKEAKQLLQVIQDHLEKLLETKKPEEMNMHETPPAPPTTPK